MAINSIIIILILFSTNSATQEIKDKIANLPGAPNADFNQFSGYITVDNKKGRALFYWLTESGEESEKKPLIIWMSGGPGCSSLGYGAISENGPFFINNDGNSLANRIYPWNSDANMLYLETPAGTGFSYSNLSSYENYNNQITAGENVVFIVKWMERFPRYRLRNLYIAGTGYSGIFVTELASRILEQNKDSTKTPIKLVGILLQNPFLDYYQDEVVRIEYMFSHGVISRTTYTEIKKSCLDEFKTGEFSEKCNKLIQNDTQYEGGDIDWSSLYTTPCSNTPKNISPFEYNACYEKLPDIYFNNINVQKAMHVDTTHGPQKWNLCNQKILDGWDYSVASVLPLFNQLIAADVKIIIYSGDTDTTFSFSGTRDAIDSLNLTIIRDHRPWYIRQLHSGWVINYKGLEFVTIRGGNHEVSQQKPAQSLKVFRHFIDGSQLSDNPYV